MRQVFAGAAMGIARSTLYAFVGLARDKVPFCSVGALRDQSLEVVDTAYHAAGSTAIFEENPFERRFRDIRTVSQQLQGRSEHFETLGQFLLGLEPGSTAWL